MKRMGRSVIGMLCLLCVWGLCGSLTAHAQIPRLINYQGKLTDASGVPLGGAYDLTFRIYNAQEAGTLLWEEAHAGVVVEGGLFDVLLGSVTSLDLAFDMPYFLEIKVGQEVMAPRQQIASAAYAFRTLKAEDALTVSGYSVSAVPAANKLLPMNGNGYLPASALRVFDSGWFAVARLTSYTKTHNLGTTKVLPIIYFSPTSNGSGDVVIMGGSINWDGYYYIGINLYALTATSLSIRTNSFMTRYANASQINNVPTSGYVRIILIALE